MKSADEGKSWTEPRELVPGDEGGRGPVRNKILRLSDGSLLAPASIEQGEWRCFMDRSEDEGETWTRTTDIRAPQPLRRNSAVALGGRSGRSCAAAHLAGLFVPHGLGGSGEKLVAARLLRHPEQQQRY